MKIIVSKDDKPIEQLTFDGNVTIGRKSDCDISIKDPAVSGLHAIIEKVGVSFIIKDEGSTNGIFIRGKRIKQQVLKNEDVISVGEHRLKILLAADPKEVASAKTEVKIVPPPKVARTGPAPAEGRPAAPARPVARRPAGETVVTRPAASETVVTRPPAGETRESTGARGFLKVTSGARAGSRISLDDGLTTIGEPGIQVAAVSRRPQGHFIIHVDGGKDRERVPLVNGEPTGFKSRKLEHGDKIEVAGIQMEYHED